MKKNNGMIFGVFCSKKKFFFFNWWGFPLTHFVLFKIIRVIKKKSGKFLHVWSWNYEMFLDENDYYRNIWYSPVILPPVPVLQINEEFRRCNTIPLESTFISQLDRYTPKLLELFSSKGGAVGQRIKSVLIELIQVGSVWSNFNKGK